MSQNWFFGMAIEGTRRDRKSGENSGQVVSAAGFEPATHALKGHCSTN
jgi:hypothetical protein